MSFTQVVVSGSFTDLYGANCSGRIVFNLNDTMSQQGVTTYPQNTENIALITNGTFSITLPSTEDSQTQPQGVTYTASIQITDSEGNIIEPYSVTFQLPAVSTFDFRTVTPALTVPSYTYLSTNGGTLNGNLTLDTNAELILENALLTNGDLTLTPGKPQLAHYTPIASLPPQYPNSPFDIPMPADKQIHLVCPQGFDHQIFFSGSTTISGTQYASITVYDSILNTVSDYPISTGGTYFEGIVIGGDGQVYALEVNSLGLIAFNPTTHVFTTYGLPSGYSGGDRLVTDSNGNIVQNIKPTAGSNYNLNFLVFDTQTHEFLPPIQYNYILPNGTALIGPNQNLCSGDDGLLWYFSPFGNLYSVIVSLAPTTCQVVSYQVFIGGTGASIGMFQFGVDGGDRHIYTAFNNDGSGQTYLARQNKDTGLLQWFELPGTTNTYPLGIALHSDGFIYCADVNNPRVFRFDRFTTNIEEIPTLNTGYNSLGITGDGNLYFGGTGTGYPAQGLRFDEILLNNNTWTGQNTFNQELVTDGPLKSEMGFIQLPPNDNWSNDLSNYPSQIFMTGNGIAISPNGTWGSSNIFINTDGQLTTFAGRGRKTSIHTSSYTMIELSDDILVVKTSGITITLPAVYPSDYVVYKLINASSGTITLAANTATTPISTGYTVNGVASVTIPADSKVDIVTDGLGNFFAY